MMYENAIFFTKLVHYLLKKLLNMVIINSQARTIMYKQGHLENMGIMIKKDQGHQKKKPRAIIQKKNRVIINKAR